MVQRDHFSNFIDWLATFTEQHPPGSFLIYVDLQEPKPPDTITDLSVYLTLPDKPGPRLTLIRADLDSLQRMRLKTAVTPLKKLGWEWNDSDAIRFIIHHYFFLYEFDRFFIKKKSIFSYFPWLSVPRYPLFSLVDILVIWEYSGGDMVEALPANLKYELSSAEKSKFFELVQSCIPPKISAPEPTIKITKDVSNSINTVNPSQRCPVKFLRMIV
ncbi:MAG: hypothetical protein Q8O92_14025 [Candidatus Latescibacter sp.]|nr:hypothetical protein [Candidatus Latescibacter sp.]